MTLTLGLILNYVFLCENIIMIYPLVATCWCCAAAISSDLALRPPCPYTGGSIDLRGLATPPRPRLAHTADTTSSLVVMVTEGEDVR